MRVGVAGLIARTPVAKPATPLAAATVTPTPTIPIVGALLPTPTPTPTPAPTATPAPTLARLQVKASEFALVLSRPNLTAGQASIEFNSSRAQDPHDLHLVDGGGNEVVAFDEQPAGAVNTKKTTLAPGTYRLFCSLPGHDALGMHATLTVGP